MLTKQEKTEFVRLHMNMEELSRPIITEVCDPFFKLIEWLMNKLETSKEMQESLFLLLYDEKFATISSKVDEWIRLESELKFNANGNEKE